LLAGRIAGPQERPTLSSHVDAIEFTLMDAHTHIRRLRSLQKGPPIDLHVHAKERTYDDHERVRVLGVTLVMYVGFAQSFVCPFRPSFLQIPYVHVCPDRTCTRACMMCYSIYGCVLLRR
jgi:hypothetical protein